MAKIKCGACFWSIDLIIMYYRVINVRPVNIYMKGWRERGYFHKKFKCRSIVKNIYGKTINVNL